MEINHLIDYCEQNGIEHGLDIGVLQNAREEMAKSMVAWGHGGMEAEEHE